MKLKTLILLTLMSFSFANCQMTKKAVREIPEPSIEDHASSEYIFEKGVYYAFVFPEGPSYGFDQIAQISKFLAAKIDFDDVWYKSGASGCRPPGSDMAMSVMVDPALLVLLDKADKKLEEMGYILVTEPSMGDCAFHVKRYKF